VTTIDVPGARIHYDLCGEGPFLVLIPGANGDGRGFAALAERLQDRYTVAAYDRRGFSRSTLNGPQDYGHRLDTDADDVRALIEHAGHPNATILGSSSGALVALHLLTRHPEVVTTLIPYEPPAVRLLPDGQKWIDFFQPLYDHYR
jgi:pimeloyl-ACP methyl ester carboxylesterase